MAEYKLGKLGQEVTLTATIETTRELKIRMAIAIFLIRIAAIVLDCKLVVGTPQL